MTYLVWEKQLLGYLKSQPEAEKKQIVDYYREMYNEKMERGLSNEQVLLEFGDPKNCAARILMEPAIEEEHKYSEATEKSKKQKSPKPDFDELITKVKRKTKGLSVGSAVGWFFITVILLIPLGAVAVSVIATFAALALSGFVMILGGAVGAVASPFGLFLGWSGGLTVSAIGTCVALAGVGAIFAVIFTLLTKYSSIGLYKSVAYLTKRSDKQ